MFRCREGTSNRGAHDGETSNFVFALPFFAHLTENFAVVAGPGLEVVSLEKGHDDEKESEFLVRFCTIYEVELDDWVFAPPTAWGPREWPVDLGLWDCVDASVNHESAVRSAGGFRLGTCD